MSDILKVEINDIGEVSDGYHTFNELYEHRHMLFINFLLFIDTDYTFKSRLHNDGSSYDGWFIAGVNTTHGQITYHLPDRLWDLCELIPTVQNAPEWDGHTSNDVIDRLRLLISEQH